jgi:RHS repeat-associated protein
MPRSPLASLPPDVDVPLNREVLEYDGASGAILRWYAYGLGSNDVLNQMNVGVNARATFVPDIQGSVIASLDSGSGALSKIGYLPYGKSSAAPGSFGYTAQRVDPETNGLYYYRARMYYPTWGRFMQPDPRGTQGGINLYAYVNNDPLNLTDPSGLDYQISVGVSGTLALVFGLGGSFSGGINIPSNMLNIGGYQLFATLQGNGMLGIGGVAAAGFQVGVSKTDGPLPAFVSTSSGSYVEADIAFVGASAGVSAQTNVPGALGVPLNPSAVAGGSVGVPVKYGAGVGVYAGWGSFNSVTLATPTLEQLSTPIAAPADVSSYPGIGNLPNK